MAMFLGFFGRDRRPETLSQRDWDRFIRERRAGKIGPSGKPVGNRMIEWDLTFLMAVLNWAARSRDEHGRPLLERNPLKGLRKPREKNPTRVVLTEEEYRALLRVSQQVDWRFHVALVLAHETGQHVTDDPNHRKKPRKFNRDCTICPSCRQAKANSHIGRQRDNRVKWREAFGVDRSNNACARDQEERHQRRHLVPWLRARQATEVKYRIAAIRDPSSSKS